MKKLLLLLTLVSFQAHAQVLDTSKLEAKLTAQDVLNETVAQEILDLIERVEKLEKGTPAPLPSIKLPYGNWENSKFTFPDAKEYPALEVMKMTSEYIKFNVDGSITYSLPAGLTGTPTANAKFLRIERREYENMLKKENYEKGDVLVRTEYVTFHKLNLGVDDVVFSQVHGAPYTLNGVTSDTPYFKWVAGKNGIRIQAKTKWNLAADNVIKIIIPKDQLKENFDYPFYWDFNGVTLNYDVNGMKGSIPFDRPDEYYPKDGAYGPVGVSLTHRAF